MKDTEKAKPVCYHTGWIFSNKGCHITLAITFNNYVLIFHIFIIHIIYLPTIGYVLLRSPNDMLRASKSPYH